MKRFGVFSRGLRRLPGLGEFLGGEIVPVFFRTPPDLDATLGWGRRKYSRRPRKVAERLGIPFICLEDGFLRSIGLGKEEPPLSIVVDDKGIYYDATAPSRLEALVSRALSPDESARASALIGSWRSTRVSKYNHAAEFREKLGERYVLVIDQTAGDASIGYGLADAGSFNRMLEAAVSENPGCAVLVKIHPDVFAGKKKGHFQDKSLAKMPGVRILTEDVHPVRMLEGAQTIYTVTSQVGFEGLLWGRRVRTFGMPFYAGWGLTCDDLPAPCRRGEATVEQLAHAALVEYPRYIDPETGERCEPERLIDYIGSRRRMRERNP